MDKGPKKKPQWKKKQKDNRLEREEMKKMHGAGWNLPGKKNPKENMGRDTMEGGENRERNSEREDQGMGNKEDENY